MFVLWMALNRKHQATKMCTKRVERKIKRLREEEAQAIMKVDFQAYKRPLETAK